MLPLVELDDPLNAIGRVRRGHDGPEVVVSRAADIIRVGDLGDSGPASSPEVDAAASAGPTPAAEVRLAGLAAAQAAIWVAALLLATAATVFTLVLRRRRGDRLLTLVRARLPRHVTHRTAETADPGAAA